MDYETACEAIVTQAEALREIDRHSASHDEFFADCGRADSYVGQVVLDWLGY